MGDKSRFRLPPRFGNRALEFLWNRYLERGIKLLHTGRDGIVTASTGGSNVEIQTDKAGRKRSR